MKSISDQKEWDMVLRDLGTEQLKLASYDYTLLPLLGEVYGKKILDYGSGPGVLADVLQKLGADIRVYDLNPAMRKEAALKIGKEKVLGEVSDIPHGSFDIIIINLVMCIVPEKEVKAILQNAARFIRKNGTVYVGFCNPEIFRVPETNLDFRFPTGEPYGTNHAYRKIKKEGGYEIIESHRPLEWYENAFRNAGFRSIRKFFTPEYQCKGQKVKDFAIFELK